MMTFDGLLDAVQSFPQRTIQFSTKTRTTHSFDQFSSDVSKLHEHLNLANIPPRARIGLQGENSYAWLVWNFALVTANYVPVNFTEDHIDRLPEDLIHEHELWLLVTDRHASNPSNSIVDLHEYNAPIKLDTTRTGAIESNQDILTLVFSSGTTGHLKGLIISKSGTENILQQFIEAYSITDEDRYLSFLPFSYFQQAALNYCAIYCGVSIFVTGQATILEELRRCKPTFIIAPPVFHESIYNMAQVLKLASIEGNLANILGGHIRFMITAMAPIQPNIIQYFWDHSIALYQTYAVTETGMATWNTPKANKIGSVGQASEAGTLTIAHDGELLIKRSKPVSLGYFNVAKAVEEETFIYGGYVATGDIVEVDSEGFYRIIGRKKHAIVTPEGKKFHPEEVESLLKDKVAGAMPFIYLDQGTQQISLMVFVPEKVTLTSNDISRSIAELNTHIPTHKQIRKACKSAIYPSWGNGFLTRNLKLNRQAIQQALIQGSITDVVQIDLREKAYEN